MDGDGDLGSGGDAQQQQPRRRTGTRNRQPSAQKQSGKEISQRKLPPHQRGEARKRSKTGGKEEQDRQQGRAGQRKTATSASDELKAARERIAELEKNSSHAKRCESLLIDKMNKVEELQTLVRQLKENKKSEAEELRTSIKQLKERKAVLIAENKQHKEDKKTLRTSIKELKQQNDLLFSENKQLRENKKSESDELLELRTCTEQLQQQNAVLVRENKKLMEEDSDQVVQDLRRVVKTLTTQKTALQSSYNTLRETVAELKKENKNRSTELEDSVKVVQDLRRVVKTLTTQKTALQSSYNTLWKTVAELKKENKNCSTELEKKEAHTKRCESRLVGRRTKVEELEARVKKLREKRKAEVEELQTSVKRHKSKNTALVAEMKQLKKDANKEVQELKKENKELMSKQKTERGTAFHDAAFEENLAKLKAFKATHGRCNPSSSSQDPEEKKLGGWVVNLRRRCKNRPDRIQKLMEVGFDFRTSQTCSAGDEQQFDQQLASIPPRRTRKTEKSFEENLAKLKAFKQKHGHCNASTVSNDPEERKLGSWVTRTRSKHKKHREGKGKPMPPERIQKLVELGFDFNIGKTAILSWNERFEQLKEYQRRYHSTHVSTTACKNEAPAGLGFWVQHQRGHYKRLQLHGMTSSILTAERIELLDSIGFQWKLRDRGPSEKRKQMIQAAAAAAAAAADQSKDGNDSSPSSLNDNSDD